VHEGEGGARHDAEAHPARTGRRLEARLVAVGLQRVDSGDELLRVTDPEPRRNTHADRLHGLVRDDLVLEDGHGLRRRREQRGADGLEVRAVLDDRRLVQARHEHVDGAARALVERELDVRGGGEALGLQVGGVGGGQDGGVGVAVRRMDLHGAVAGISPQLIHEEDVLRVRAVEPDAYARDHARPPFKGRGQGEASPARAGERRGHQTALREGKFMAVVLGRSYGLGGASRATRVLRIPGR